MHVAKNWLMLNLTDYMSQISLWLGPWHQGAGMENGNLTRDQLQASPGSCYELTDCPTLPPQVTQQTLHLKLILSRGQMWSQCR